VRAACVKSALRARRSGDLVVRSGQSRYVERAGRAGGRRTPEMTAYIARRILFMIPTLFGIMLVSFLVVQFAPGGPVERMIAKISGQDTGATSRISGSASGDFAARNQFQGAGSEAVNSKYRGAQGLDPEFIKSLEKQFGF